MSEDPFKEYSHDERQAVEDAFAAGAKIEVHMRHPEWNGWWDSSTPTWQWHKLNFRVKEQ